MANWLVREDSSAIDFTPSQTTFRIRSVGRKPSLGRGDTVVVYSRVRTSSFLVEGIVSRVETTLVDEKSRLFDTSVTVGQWIKLDHETTIEELAYSLQIIRQPKRPNLYLRLPYRSVQKNDLETIRNGEPYVARHVYHLLVDALPPITQAQFRAEQLLMEAQGALEASDRDYQSRLQALCAFLDNTVMPIGILLRALTDEIAGCELLESAGQSIEHVVGFEDERSSNFRDDSIFEQDNRFDRLYGAIRGPGISAAAPRIEPIVFRSVVEELRPIATENVQQHFAQLFENDPL
jgi:hypothetical protein